MDAWHYDEGLLLVSLSGKAMVREKSRKDGATNRVSLVPQGHGEWSSASRLVNGQCSGRQDNEPRSKFVSKYNEVGSHV